MQSLRISISRFISNLLIMPLFLLFILVTPVSDSFIGSSKLNCQTVWNKGQNSITHHAGKSNSLKAVEYEILPGQNDFSVKQKISHAFGETESLYLLSTFGVIHPTGAYGKSFSPGFRVGLTTGVPLWRVWKLIPEAHFNYAKINGKAEKEGPGSSITLVQFTVGLLYRREFELPSIIRRYLGFLKPDVIFQGRIYDGVSLFSFTMKDLNIETTEAIHTCGFSFGLIFSFHRFVQVGVDAGYEVVFAKGDPLQAVIFGFVAGVGF